MGRASTVLDLGEIQIQPHSRRSIHLRHANVDSSEPDTLMNAGTAPVIRTITVIDEEGRNSDDAARPPKELGEQKRLWTSTSTRARLQSILQNVWVTLLMSLATLVSLFGDDARLAWTTISADDAWTVLFTFTAFLFVIEFSLMSLSTPGYANSFAFWLDIMSILAMFAEIPWVMTGLLEDLGLSSAILSNLNVTRAGRISKLGTRAARVTRIVRMARLFRISNVLSFGMKKIIPAEPNAEEALDPGEPDMDISRQFFRQGSLARKESGATVRRDDNQDDNEDDSPVEGTVVGRTLSELTTKRVIMIILMVLLIVPLLSVDISDAAVSVSLQRIEASASRPDLQQLYIDTLIGNPRISLLYLQVGSVIYVDMPISDFRLIELDYTFESISQAIVDVRSSNIAQAQMSMLLMLLTVVALGTGAFLFSRDAFLLVIGPIERMVGFVKKLATNPLDIVSNNDSSPSSKTKMFETELLEATLIKLGCLLQIGFGSAGASIIAKNFKHHGKMLNPMIPGSRINGVFAFCDIRRFTDTTECLQESVMVFVNEIANIVHGCCHRLGGAANKNIGDAFFIVWKMNRDGNQMEQEHLIGDSRRHIADQAVIAFVHCVVELLTSPLMQRWRDDQRINERMPGYNINLGVGIHWGWAIEGAIGTEQKIDASYLSPHVDMSQTLEELTKVYGVPLLFSGEVYSILSPTLQQMCRFLDVIYRRTEYPLKVYTFDIGGEALEIQRNEPAMPRLLTRASISLTSRKSPWIGRWSTIDAMGDLVQNPVLLPADLIAEEPEDAIDDENDEEDTADNLINIDFNSQVKPFRIGIDPKWIDLFNRATSQYVLGKWEIARDLLHICQAIVPRDKPTQFLLEYMGASKYIAPSSWDGCRRSDSH